MEKQRFSNDFGGCEESITFQNRGNPQKRSSRAKVSRNSGAPKMPEVGLSEAQEAPRTIDPMAAGLIFEALGLS